MTDIWSFYRSNKAVEAKNNDLVKNKKFHISIKKWKFPAYIGRKMIFGKFHISVNIWYHISVNIRQFRYWPIYVYIFRLKSELLKIGNLKNSVTLAIPEIKRTSVVYSPIAPQGSNQSLVHRLPEHNDREVITNWNGATNQMFRFDGVFIDGAVEVFFQLIKFKFSFEYFIIRQNESFKMNFYDFQKRDL